MTTLKNFQDVELEVKRTNLEVDRLLTDVRLILDRINHITGISGSFSASPSLVTDHGILSGLGDDDHPHYILVSGTRPFTGDQSHGDFNITNVGDISLDSISSDGSTITIGSTPNIVLTDNTTIAITLGNDAGDNFSIDTSAFIVKGDTGQIGLGTSAIPHGGIGAAKLAIEGPNASTSGPHIQITTASDDRPLFQVLAWQHDDISLSFDAYYDGAERSSDIGSNFQIRKLNDKLRLRYASGVTPGNAITWNDGIVLSPTDQIGMGLTLPSALDGLVHIHSGTAGAVTASTNADEVVLEGDNNAGMHVLNPDVNAGAVYFGSPGEQVGAAIAWLYGAAGATSLMSVGTKSVAGQLSLQTGSGLEAIRIDANQKVGINTVIIPHGGIGGAMLALDGANASIDGPHIQVTTATDNYPLLQIFSYAHDNISIDFDSYWDGSKRSSDVGSNFQIQKNSDTFQIRYASGIAQGAIIAYNTGIVLDASGQVGVRTIPTNDFHVAGEVTLIPASGVALTFGGVNSSHIISINTIITSSGNPQILRVTPGFEPTGAISSFHGINVNPSIGGSSANGITSAYVNNARFQFSDSYSGTVTNLFSFYVTNPIDGSSATPVITNHYGLYIANLTYATNAWGIYQAGTQDNYFGGDIGVGIVNLDGTVHIHTATAGSVTADGSANELVLENSGDCGLSILAPNASTSALVFGSPADISGAWVSWNFNSKLFEIGSTTTGGEIRMNTGAGNLAVYIDSSQNLGIRTSTAFGSGGGVLGIANASTNPSTNPTGGGVLYSDGGAGKWRSSGGTTTTFGPAEPHCAVCGRDFVLEWENKKTGHLIVCMWCLTKELGKEKWITRVN